MTIAELLAWLDALDLAPAQVALAGRLLEALRARVRTAHEVGLGYLALDRQVRTLSGGEAQRIQLATALGGTLTATRSSSTLRVVPGGVLALVGPNGAGKTTLLMLLAFLARPGRGRLEFLGDDPWAGEDRLVAARREAVLVTHHPYLFRGSIADNVSFGLKLRKAPEAEMRTRVRSALALVELDGHEKEVVSGLSAGQAQRVALARAMALRPRALLLDEPTANIDAGLALRMEAVLREVSRESGTAVVFSTNNNPAARFSLLRDRLRGL